MRPRSTNEAQHDRPKELRPRAQASPHAGPAFNAVALIDGDLRPRFYREWSSRAAREALEASQAVAKRRCSLSASIWCSIADAIEAGDETRVAALSRNSRLPTGSLLGAGPLMSTRQPRR